MDPNLFAIDWERVLEALAGIVVLAFLLERGLALLFESKFFVDRLQGRSLKELIAFVLGALVCWYWDFDAISIIFVKGKVTVYGAILTGAIVGGGSKAAIRLFVDLMGFGSQALKEQRKLAKQGVPPAGGP